MAFLWTGPSTSITGLDGRIHDRDGRGRQLAAGPVRVLCGRVMTPNVLAAPIGDPCPDCATLKHRTPRGVATPLAHAEHRTHGSVGSADVCQDGATTMNETNKPSELLSAMADAITNNPAGIAALLARHVDDGTGHCRGCSLGGQRGYATANCILRAAATLATERRNLADRTLLKQRQR